MSNDKLTIKIKGKEYKLKITIGFWRKCGFKREEIQIIENDVDVYLKALKLALFYGNKVEYGWSNPSDMEPLLNDSVLEDIEEDYTQNISYAAIHYLPKEMRKIILSKMGDMEKRVSEAVDAEIGGALGEPKGDHPDQDLGEEEKKN